jgi:tetratricopeptide (TPR) repeat protein
MPNIARRAIALFVLLLTVASTGVAANSDFYLNLLRRGISNYETGHYDVAVRELDVAAFGLIESIDHFETAKLYATLANDKLSRPVQARASAQRLLAAERVQRRFAQITFPNEVRAAFLVVARRVLTAPEVAALTSNAPIPPSASATQPRVTQNPQGVRPAPQQTVPNPAPPKTAVQQPPVVPPVIPAPQNSSTTKAEPQPQPQIVEKAPVTPDPIPPTPVKQQPQVAETPKPGPTQTQTTTPPKVIETRVIELPADPPPAKPQPRVEPPKVEPPRVEPPKVEPKPAPTKPAAAVDAAAQLVAAERLIGENNLIEAREIYRQLADAPSLDRASLLAVVEGAYRARDFATAIRAFDRIGTLTKGEEPYRYYLAVALYETGNYKRSKRELAAALPHIEVTPSVQRYRAKIEGAID